MSSNSFTRIVLRERPQTDILHDTFELQTVSKDVLKAGPGEVIVRVTYLSLDPAMRAWLRPTRTYIAPVQIGEVMRSLGIGIVVEAGEGSIFTKGDVVSGSPGWAEFAVLKDAELEKITYTQRFSPKTLWLTHSSPLPGTTELDFLNTLGVPGLTAYFGLYDIGKLKARETLLVSGAAGAVGSLVCQLGKRAGARVVALAGSDEKCTWLKRELGVDVALNYKHKMFQENFKNAVGYFDVFFDNVGGEILDLALKRLSKGARIVLSGAISSYNASTPRGLENYANLIVMRAKIEGFVVIDYASQFPRAIADLAVGLADGTIKRKFHVVEGLENAPKALPLLYSGGNTGKLVVRVSDNTQLPKL